jgi:uncharacterized protein (DUF1697 family)
MHQYVAFLRAINVGGHTVKMDRLRALFAALGFSCIETFIASGNVIFESSAENTGDLEERIEQHLRQALGYEVATFIRSTTELPAIAHHQPFSSTVPDAEGYALSIAFLKAPPSDEAREKLLRFRTAIDDFHLHQREVYWLCRTRVSQSTFSGALLEKALGMPATMCNVTTVRKLAARYAPPR